MQPRRCLPPAVQLGISHDPPREKTFLHHHRAGLCGLLRPQTDDTRDRRVKQVEFSLGEPRHLLGTMSQPGQAYTVRVDSPMPAHYHKGCNLLEATSMPVNLDTPTRRAAAHFLVLP